MPSPRKGGTTPIRRRRKARTGPRTPPAPAPPFDGNLLRPGRRFSAGSVESDSSWTDTTDTSLVTTTDSRSSSSCSSSRSPGSCSSSSSTSSWTTVSIATSPSSCSSSDDSSTSSPGSGSDGDDSGSEDDDDEDEVRCRRRARLGPGLEPRAAREKRGRSCSRRGARQRGGSVLCRYCGRRGYGVMKMVLSCCHMNPMDVSAEGPKGPLGGTPEGPRSPRSPTLLAPAGPRREQAAPAPAGCPSPRYNWSPCSSDSSSSTLSEDGSVSSGDDADVEEVPLLLARTHLPFVCHGGHVAVS